MITTTPSSTTKGTLLIVDDVPANVSVLFDFLSNAGFKVLVAPDGERALRSAEFARPDLILLDIVMPGMDGFEVCRILKSRESTRDIPIIFMTALADVVDKVRGFEMGAVDYATKPMHYEEILARVTTHLKLRKLQQELQQQNRQLQDEIKVRKRVEVSLQQTAEELRQLNIEHQKAREMAELASRAKTVFLANMSHELRTPLNAIIGYSDIINEDATDQGLNEMADDANRIKEAANNLLYILSDVLELTKIETEVLNPALLSSFDIAELISESAGVVQPLLQQRGNQLKIHCPATVGSLFCDFNKVRQILTNLLSNAVKFTQNGVVTVAVEPTEEWLILKVQDTGIGIPPQYHEEIFRPFFQVDSSPTRKYGGTGLGLTICKAYCRIIGGQVSLSSEAGKGSLFTLKLPYREPIEPGARKVDMGQDLEAQLRQE